MKHLDLFSGIGGFALAAESVGFETIGFSEIDPYASAILKKHWPHVKNYGDITKADLSEFKGNIDLITGGFPCQPFSVGGKQLGDSDERHLWPHLVRILSEIRPTFALFENVPGLLSISGGRVFNGVLSDLCKIGYDCLWNLVPASAIGANHQRDRVWIIAHTNGIRRNGLDKNQEKQCETINIESKNRWRDDQNFISVAMEGYFPNESSGLERNDDGLSQGMDRLKCIGNAIVPQVAQILLKEIYKNLSHPTPH